MDDPKRLMRLKQTKKEILQCHKLSFTDGWMGRVEEQFCKNDTLMPALNFINVLRKAFTHTDPICVKIMTVKLSVFFTLLGSMRVKAARKTLMKLTLAVNFINTFYKTAFLSESISRSFFVLTVWISFLGKSQQAKKVICKMLVKLFTGGNPMKMIKS